MKIFHTHIENVNFTVSYQFFSVRSFLRWCQQCLMKWRHNLNNFCEKKLSKQLITCLKGLRQVEDYKKRKLGDIRTHNFFDVSIFDHVSTSWTRWWRHATPGSREKKYYLLKWFWTNFRESHNVLATNKTVVLKKCISLIIKEGSDQFHATDLFL